MVAYSFKRRFVAPIEARTKLQTIRRERRRQARPGEELQLYQGMRTRQCRLIGRPVCRSVLPLIIDIADGGITMIDVGGQRLAPNEMHSFACADGFSDLADMSRFWLEEHGAGRFTGVLITWDWPEAQSNG